MNKYIVTTTIQAPTEATIKFSQIKGWKLVVVGDKKTPHDLYKDLNCIYLDPVAQDILCPELSKFLGWNTIQRRNIGFIYAYRNGADIVATVDDDNVPYSTWGLNCKVNDSLIVNNYRNFKHLIADPLAVTNNAHLWHRGYPLNLLREGRSSIVLDDANYFIKNVDVQADLWDGSPDIDAVCRLMYPNEVVFDPMPFFSFSKNIVPFNSQNTFLSRRILPHYMVLPFSGRLDDIWGGYLMQHEIKSNIVFGSPSVYQKRNLHNTLADFAKEVIGIENNKTFEVAIGNKNALPKETLLAYKLYRKEFK